MRTRWIVAVAIGAIATAGCDFTGLPDDRGPLTKGPGADGAADASLQDASTASDAASGADATVPSDAGSAADAGNAVDAGDACTPKSAGELAVERCGARVCGTIDVTDNCGASRSISCGTCANGAPCEQGGTCGCAAETQQQLVNLHCGVGSCGDKSVTDRCGAQRTISCGTTCSGQGETCGGGDPGTANVCGCTPETAAQFCARYGKNCSTFSGPDNCGVRRTNVACGSCTLPQTCGGAGSAGVCGCTPTTCAAQGKNCGSIPDECGATLNCGSTCSGLGATCGGGNPGIANVCGCTPESDQALCALEGANCGSITTADRCGATRTVASCGTCSGTGVTCGGGGTPKQCGCTPESNAAFCTRVGADCGSKSGTDNCGQARSVANCGTCANGGTCSAQNTCPWVGSTGELGARTASMTGDGLSNCGPNGDDNCARSPLVTGGTFSQGTVSDFRLDTYEVTVGRFRKFVDAWVGGWRPQAASGKHWHLNAGSGLANRGNGSESGWDPTLTPLVGSPTGGGAAPPDRGTWDQNLRNAGYCTWTSAPGPNEKRPATCLNWYDMYAFCIWDGGFLPSNTEWQFAWSAGAEERAYPWGATAPGQDASLAVYDCYLNGTGAYSCRDSDQRNIANVGSLASGAGRWSQLDLAGNAMEWVLDSEGGTPGTCVDCTFSAVAVNKIMRGGSFWMNGNAFGGAAVDARGRYYYYGSGGRCARSP